MDKSITKEQFEFLKERLAFAHKDKSNEASDYRAITDRPIFFVQELFDVGVFDGDYTPNGDGVTKVQYVHDDSSYETIQELEDFFDDFDDLKEAIKDVNKIDVYYMYVNVCAHLTREAAQLYIDQNKHNLKSPRIYVKSMNRCHEMIGLVEAVMSGKLVYKD